MHWELLECRNDIIFTLYPLGLAQYLRGNKYLSLEVLALIGHSSIHGLFVTTFILSLLNAYNIPGHLLGTLSLGLWFWNGGRRLRFHIFLLSF